LRGISGREFICSVEKKKSKKVLGGIYHWAIRDKDEEGVIYFLTRELHLRVLLKKKKKEGTIVRRCSYKESESSHDYLNTQSRERERERVVF